MRNVPHLADDEYGYHPAQGAARALAEEWKFDEVLVVGQNIPDLADLVGGVRFLVQDEAGLSCGLYWFMGGGIRRLMILTDPTHPSPPITGMPEELDDDHPLVHALGWFDEWWSRARPVPVAAFRIDDQVLVLPDGRDASVRRRTFQSGLWMYDVRVDGRMRTVTETSLANQPVDDDAWEWIRKPPESADGFAATLTRAKLNSRLSDTVYSFRATRTLFRPYQFKPVMKLLQTGSLRLLVADEVGLGKTIEAGLLWTELEARGMADRVLVLSPSSLVGKWKREMDERFGFELRELDSAGLADLHERLVADRLPARSATICSIERLRMWEGLEEADELRLSYDLIIVDEAHAFRNIGTKSHQLGSLISTWTDALVFLSATPLNLRTSDLYSLLSLLVPGEFDSPAILAQRLEPNALLNEVSASFFDPAVDNERRRVMLAGIRRLTFAETVTNRHEFSELIRILDQEDCSPGDIARAKRLITELSSLAAAITRTRKVEVQELKPVRVPHTIPVRWNPEEQTFHDLFHEWCEMRAAMSNTPVGFSMQMPLRLVSSCLQVARQQVLNWHPGQAQPVDEDDPENSTSSTADQVPPPPELIAAARTVGAVDSKFDALLPHLESLVQQDQRTLLFTFSRPTLTYLENKLSPKMRVAVLHGDVPKKTRDVIMRDFRSGEYDLVLANRVASEGLDFEFCSTVVNYDLPWNPMEVEQRIGRIDRIGQMQPRIQVVSFHTPGTIESTIIERVMERIGVFQRSIGELEPIIQRELDGLRKTVFDFSLTEGERDRRAQERLAAIEEKALAQRDLESAEELLSRDGAEVEGFERDLVGRGGYVGQLELALLIKDWVRLFPDAEITVDEDENTLFLRGTPSMAKKVQDLARTGVRSGREVDDLVRGLREETQLSFSLDQERARTSGSEELITANHPLVKTALQFPGHRQIRHACVRIDPGTENLPVGKYFVELSVANWDGVRPTKEIWSAVADLDLGVEGPSAIGDAVLARLAGGQLNQAEPAEYDDLYHGLTVTERLMLSRQIQEREIRSRDNEALLASRRISIVQVHANQRQIIQRTIETLREQRKLNMIPQHEGKLRKTDQREQDALDALEAKSHCDLYLEPLAVVTVEVTR